MRCPRNRSSRRAKSTERIRRSSTFVAANATVAVPTLSASGTRA